MNDKYLLIQKELSGTLSSLGVQRLENFFAEGLEDGQIILRLNSDPDNFLDQDEEYEEDSDKTDFKEIFGWAFIILTFLFLFQGEPDVFDALQSSAMSYFGSD